MTSQPDQQSAWAPPSPDAVLRDGVAPPHENHQVAEQLIENSEAHKPVLIAQLLAQVREARDAQPTEVAPTPPVTPEERMDAFLRRRRRANEVGENNGRDSA